MQKLMLLITLSINIFAHNTDKDISAKIKSVLRTKKNEFAVGGAIVSSFVVGGGSIVLVRYILKQRSKKQTDQDKQDQAEYKEASIESNTSAQDTNEEQDQIDASDDENTDQNSTEQSDNTTGSKSVDNGTTPVIAVCETSVSAPNAQANTWQINKDLTEKAPENFKGHWKVLELEQDGKKSFCINVFEVSNTDKRNIKQKDIEKATSVIFSEFTKLIAQNMKKATEEQHLTIFLKYYTGSDDEKERNCAWQKDKPWIIEL